MTSYKIQTRTFEKKKGTSTEICADVVVSDDVRLSLKVAVAGELSPEREETFRSLLEKHLLGLIDDGGFSMGVKL